MLHAGVRDNPTAITPMMPQLFSTALQLLAALLLPSCGSTEIGFAGTTEQPIPVTVDRAPFKHYLSQTKRTKPAKSLQKSDEGREE
jgi:hypothetical protein